MQYKEQIIQRLPKIDYPEISSLADPSKTNNQTIEMAQYRLESIFTFLAFVQRPENNDIRYVFYLYHHILTFFYLESMLLPSLSYLKKKNSFPKSLIRYQLPSQVFSIRYIGK